MIFPLTFIKVWLKLMQKNKHCYWIKIEKSSEYNFLMVLKSCQEDPLDIIVNDTKETLELWCIHIPQLRGALWLCCVHMP